MLDTIAEKITDWLLARFFPDEPLNYPGMYEDLRLNIAEALAKYMCCCYNAFDIAKSETHQLPPKHKEGSECFRSLAEKLCALSDSMPKKPTRMKVKKADLREAAKNMYGLSNSFTTPYNCDVSEKHVLTVKKYEKNVRTLLQLQD